jgi:MFS transporter, MHS family, shikimate and dehydroshikimate transport protein
MQPPTSKRMLIEAVVASTVGTTIEWYDFFLYGTAAILVFPRLYFPIESDSTVAQLLSFSTITIGFIARPIGGFIFGYMGDRIGRKSALVSTLLLMGVSTVLIGFLPGYAQIGILAPILLTLLRFAQGLGVGGEWGGAVLLALEYAHTGKRGFYASWPQAGVPLGLLASTGAMALCRAYFSDDDFFAWGWRIPFYLSGLLIAVGMLIRMRILETPLFAALRESNQIAEAPIRETLRYHWREVLLIAGTRITENASFYIFTVFAIWYGDEILHVDKGVMMLGINIGAGVEFFTIPLFGMLSDYSSRRATYIVGCVFLMLFAFPFFMMLHTRDTIWIVFAIVLGMGIGHAMLYSVQASLIPELFGTRLRCTGASIGYQLGAPFAGGIAMQVGLLLTRQFPGEYWPLVCYILFNSLISLLCVWRLAETSQKEIV